jgi:hypothetical protein
VTGLAWVAPQDHVVASLQCDSESGTNVLVCVHLTGGQGKQRTALLRVDGTERIGRDAKYLQWPYVRLGAANVHADVPTRPHTVEQPAASGPHQFGTSTAITSSRYSDGRFATAGCPPNRRCNRWLDPSSSGDMGIDCLSFPSGQSNPLRSCASKAYTEDITVVHAVDATVDTSRRGCITARRMLARINPS